jgi:CRISPR-associated protein Cas1
MRKSYYLFNPGRLSRVDNTLKFIPVDEHGQEGQPRYIPVETASDLFVFGALDANSALYNFLGKNQTAVHFFDYYEHYTGSFMPKEYLLAGQLQVKQTASYADKKKRLAIARLILDGASFNMLKVLRYYHNRDKDLSEQIGLIETYRKNFDQTSSVSELMGLEGNTRQVYYSAFDIIINDFNMSGRSKRPPQNEVNALISLGNMMCYTACLGQIYHTQLNPTISYLHEPGARRFSLALDLAEIFKPLLVDRLVFSMLNKREIQATDFRQDLNRYCLKDSGKKTFVRAWDTRLGETIQHRSLKRSVSYKHLIRLECYKLVKHLLGDGDYKPFKIYW